MAVGFQPKSIGINSLALLPNGDIGQVCGNSENNGENRVARPYGCSPGGCIHPPLAIGKRKREDIGSQCTHGQH